EQIRLHAEQIPIAAGKLKDWFDPGLLLHKDCERQRAHPRRARTVGNVDDVDAPDLECACLLDDVVADKAFGREEFDNRRKATSGQRRCKWGFCRAWNDGRIWVRKELGRRVRKDPPSTVC